MLFCVGIVIWVINDCLEYRVLLDGILRCFDFKLKGFFIIIKMLFNF